MGRVGGRLALTAVLSALVLGQSTLELTAQSAGPASALLAAKKPASSWKTTRTEGFSGSALPKGCDPYTGKYSPGKNAWSGKGVIVDDGLLQLRLERKKTAGQPYTAGGVGCWGWPQKYGRYEIKANVPVGKGIDSSLTLWPAKAGKNSATSFTGMELLAPGPETAYVTNGYGSKSETAQVPGKYAGKFRTYVIEWAPKHVRMSVDGKEFFYSTRSYKGSRWLGLVVSNGDALTGVPDADTKLPAKLQIDRIKISSYTGVPPPPKRATPTPSALSPSATSSPSPSRVGTPPASIDPSAEAISAKTRGALAGGVWPWLLGGSLTVVSAIAGLNYWHHRRAARRTG
jgi:hypothetical protein